MITSSVLLVSICSCFASRQQPVFYADNEEVDAQTTSFPLYNKQKVEREILDLLGLDHKPHANKTEADYDQRNFMLEVYKSLEVEESHFSESTQRYSTLRLFDFHQADLILSLINKDTALELQHHASKHAELKFDLTAVPNEGHELIGAELRLLRDSASNANIDNYNISVYRLDFDTETETYLKYRIAHGRLDYGWSVLNISSTFDHWIQLPESRYGLSIEIVDAEGNFHDADEIGLSNGFIVALFKGSQMHVSMLHKRRRRRSTTFENVENSTKHTDTDDVIARKRRQATSERERFDKTYPKNQRKYRKNMCQHQGLYVEFVALSWEDWIIAPTGFYANSCRGLCSFPFNAHTKTTNHAIVQALVHAVNPAIPEPSCAPTQLDSMAMLYLDDTHSVILKKFPKMRVTACGCH